MSFSASRRCIAIAISLVLAHAPAMAQQAETRYEIKLPEQSLADSLRALGKATHVNIVFEPEAVKGIRAPVLSGNYSPEDALGQLLANTNLKFESTTGGSFWVGAPEGGASQASDPGRSPGVAGGTHAGSTSQEVPAPRSTPAFGGVTQMADILVIGQRLNAYTTTSSSGGTRTDTDLLETPQSISVITRKLMDDQQARSLADALINASGVQVSTDLNGSSYKVRGFSNTQVTIDGMGASAFSPMPIWAADSVEVLKGPEGILSGTRSEPGGTINLTLKQPQVTPIAAWTVGVGSYGLIETGVDLGGALNASKTLSYRLVAQTDRSGETAIGYDGGDSFYLAPSFRLAWGGTDFVAGLERTSKFVPTLNYAVSPIGMETLNERLPAGVFGAKDDGSDFGRTRSYYKFEQDLGDSGWTLRSRGEYMEQHVTARMWQFQGRPSSQGNGVLSAAESTLNTRSYTAQSDIVGTFSTGPLDHRVLLGVDYTKGQTAATIAIKGAVLFNIHSSPPVGSFGDLPSLFSFTTPYTGTSEAGYLLQDQISIGDRWNALLAVRRGLFHGYGAQPETRKWLPNFGLVYKVGQDASLYASRMVSYKQDSARLTPEGRMLPGTSSEQYEVGYKQDMLDRKLSFTAAAYQIKIDNSTFPIPGTLFYEARPGQTSRGVEMELRGQLKDGLDISATLTHIDVSTEDGSPATDQPRNSASLWMAYRFQSEFLRSWSVAAGVFAREDVTARRDAQVNGQYVYMNNPGNARTDLHVGYTGKSWSVNFGIRNLFDRRLYSTSANDRQAVIDDLERTYMITARANF